MSNFDMNGMMALMQMLSQQQGQNIETALKPQNKIPMSLNNRGFGEGGFSGLQRQYDFEAQKRGNTTNQMQDMVAQQKLKNEMAGLRGQGQPQQGGGGVAGFIKGLFGGGGNGQQPQQNPSQPQGSTAFSFGPQPAPTQYDDTTFFQDGKSAMKSELGWDWNDMPGGRPQGMPEMPNAPRINPKTGVADFDPYARGSMNIGMGRTQDALNKRGQKTVTYSPPASRGTPYVKTAGAPKAKVVPGQAKLNKVPVKTGAKAQSTTNLGPVQNKEDPMMGLANLMQLMSQGLPQQTQQPQVIQNQQPRATVNPNSTPAGNRQGAQFSGYTNPLQGLPVSSALDGSPIAEPLKALWDYLSGGYVRK